MTLVDPARRAPGAVALDDLDPLHAEVGYGALGRRGDLGYDGGEVLVRGRRYGSALSTHPPARLRFAVPPGCRRFRALVALNDDVADGGSHATFTVVADGGVVAEAAHVRAGAAPVPLAGDLGAASVVDLVVSTTAWAYCHAVWLDPTFDDPGDEPVEAGTISDPLLRADLIVPSGIPPAERCVATAASVGFEGWVDDLLGSARANGRCPDALLVVFALDDAPSVHEVAARHDAVVVRCRPRRALDPTAKAVLYAVGSLIPAERFVCLDADMLVLDDLGPLFATVDACPPQTILVCGEGNDHGLADLRTALDLAYGGGPDPPFFTRSGAAGGSPLVVNDGLLAGSRNAFLALERQVRHLPGAVGWVDERTDIRWRNQFALNVALVAMGSAVELDPTWNVQLHVQDVETEGGRARWRGRDVRVLHFAGVGKQKLGAFRDTVRRGSHLATLASQGRFEDALAVGRELAERGPLQPAAAERLAWLEATTAPPTPGSTDAGERPWASAVPPPLLAQIQQGVHHQRWRGRQLVKSPFDQAMYLQLLERDRPATIVEIGSKDGGSALWLADLSRAAGLGATVHSFDLHPVTGVEDPDVRFRTGDGRRLPESVTPAQLAAWPHPWLVIDDADHAEATSTAILEFFDPHLRPGDVVVVEDGNLSDLYPDLFPAHSSGPHLALKRFLARRGEAYEIAADLCDLFGHNTTTASNGILRRRREPPAPAALARLRAQPWREVTVPEEVLAVPSMLSGRERQLLHWLARHHVRGDGRIVDGGCFLGGSTVALASGLAAREDGPWHGTVVSYDLFRVEEYTLAGYGASFPDPRIGASFRPAFDANIGPWSRHVEVREGDAVEIGWTGEPIEVLFLDMVKTWELNDLVLAQFLPCLVPGHSVIVQQDELWGYAPWIHLTMELLDGCTARLDAMANGSVAYLLTAPPPDAVVGSRLRHDLPRDRKRSLMDRAVSRWRGEDRGLVELARVMLLLELDGPGPASRALAEARARHAGPPRFEQSADRVAGYLRSFSP